MQESYHLVALDKSFSHRFPLSIVRVSILNTLTPSMVSWVSKQKYIWYIWLDHLGFYFSLSSFQVEHLIIIISCPPPSPWTSPWSITWIGPPFLIHTLRSKVSPRFHQLSKTKLGLLISPFLVIDDNPFTKIFNKFFLDSCHLPKHITMCKDYGQVSSTQFGSISFLTYVLRVWIWKLCTYAWIKSLGK